MQPLRVHFSLWVKPFCLVSLLFWGYCVVWSWMEEGNLFLSLGFGAFMVLGCVLFLLIGPLEMTDEFVRHTLPFGRFEIRWDEIERIEIWNSIVLHGVGKKLVVPGFSLWTGADKDAMLELYERQIAKRGLVTVRTGKADFQISRGTKVKA